jgi:hypothetical protein
VSKAFADYNFREVCHLFDLSQDNDPSPSVFPEFICGTIFAIKFYKTLGSEFNVLGVCLADARTIDGDQIAELCLAHLINDLEVYNHGEFCF